MKCAMFNRPEIAKILLDKGADFTLKDREGRTAGDWAREMDYDILGEQLDKGCIDKNANDNALFMDDF